MKAGRADKTRLAIFLEDYRAGVELNVRLRAEGAVPREVRDRFAEERNIERRRISLVEIYARHITSESEAISLFTEHGSNVYLQLAGVSDRAVLDEILATFKRNPAMLEREKKQYVTLKDGRSRKKTPRKKRRRPRKSGQLSLPTAVEEHPTSTRVDVEPKEEKFEIPPPLPRRDQTMAETWLESLLDLKRRVTVAGYELSPDSEARWSRDVVEAYGRVKEEAEGGPGEERA